MKNRQVFPDAEEGKREESLSHRYRQRDQEKNGWMNQPDHLSTIRCTYALFSVDSFGQNQNCEQTRSFQVIRRRASSFVFRLQLQRFRCQRKKPKND